ncbi:hypothetical protein FSP39_002181 [Pinctada imbricata]|uniref:Calpain catalytic domain-containing protein n=1 Tax=Pinctada imbricata TaxID=66713 RepID=A0AA88XV12_PINIB|nr:hypothetical protein FSP39_002181 [Pinctada imbricata]
MSYSRTTRTVRTFYSDGRGPARVETKTYTYGGDGQQIEINGDGGGSNIQIGFGGRKGRQINVRGGGGDGGMSSSYSVPVQQRPMVGGRSYRKDKKDPFSGVINQSYDEAKKRCLEAGCMFEDPEFPAEDVSIFFSRAPPRPFEWKRPHLMRFWEKIQLCFAVREILVAKATYFYAR